MKDIPRKNKIKFIKIRVKIEYKKYTQGKLNKSLEKN